MQFKKTPVKELFVSSISSIRESLSEIKEKFIDVCEALRRLVSAIAFMILMVATLLLIPFLFPLIQKLIYKSQISNLRSWNKTFQREWRYQDRRSNRGIYDHPYQEIVDVIHENKESFGLIEYEFKTPNAKKKG